MSASAFLLLMLFAGAFIFMLLVIIGAVVMLSAKKTGPRPSTLPVQLNLPPRWEAKEMMGEIEVTLPSGYTFRIVRGDGRRVLSERVQWLKDTPYRTHKQVRCHDQDVFAYQAKEDDLDDISFVACKEVAGSLWYAETNGAIVEVPEPTLTPELAAEKQQIQDEMARLTASGAAMDGPEFSAVLDRLSAHTSKAMQGTPPPRSTSMTVQECDAAIAMIRSMQPR